MKPPNDISYPIEWRSLVVKSDPDWPKKSVEAPAYEFSNGRACFSREYPGQPYRWTTATS
jgi:hypothetical protein